MRGVERSTTLIMVLSTLILSAVAGLIIPWASGGQPGDAQDQWTPHGKSPTGTPIVALAAAPVAVTIDKSTPVMRGSHTPTAAPHASTSTPQNTEPALTASATLAPGTPASPTATATETAKPVRTPAPTGALAALALATPAGPTPQAQVSVDLLNLRAGPGTDAQVVGIARRGERFAIVARNANAAWLQVCCWNDAPAWLASSFVTTTSRIDGLPIVP